MRAAEHLYRSVSAVQGPLLFLDRVEVAHLGEAVEVVAPDGRVIAGEVLRIDEDTVLVQVFGEPRGLDVQTTRVRLSGGLKQIPLSRDCLGRIFDGGLRPLDGLPMYVAADWHSVLGRPMNPVARARPEEFIETGISAIDALNTLVKGQKLPVFTGTGLPGRELAGDVLRHARTAGDKGFAIVFVALGLTRRDYDYYRGVLDAVAHPCVAIVNLADRPVVERLLAPRIGLTLAEHLAFEHGDDVLVVISDMVNYCDALREVATAREELPGRRGYPGTMYSDLASLFERAGRLHDRPGSVTLLPVVTMPEDDITHPIPDLTGYITEGQLVLDRGLHGRGIYPPLDVLPSLSRLMQQGIGEGRTRAGHRQLADRLYRAYAHGRELRRLEAIVGRDGLPGHELSALDFAIAFEERFIGQGHARRSIGESLDLGQALLDEFGV